MSENTAEGFDNCESMRATYPQVFADLTPLAQQELVAVAFGAGMSFDRVAFMFSIEDGHAQELLRDWCCQQRRGTLNA